MDTSSPKVNKALEVLDEAARPNTCSRSLVHRHPALELSPSQLKHAEKCRSSLLDATTFHHRLYQSANSSTSLHALLYRRFARAVHFTWRETCSLHKDVGDQLRRCALV